MTLHSCHASDTNVLSGFGSAAGVFREYYFNHEPMKGNQLLASLGVMIVVSSHAGRPRVTAHLHEQGILQVMSPFLLHYLSSRPHQRKPMMWTGMIILVAASLGAAFSQTVSISPNVSDWQVSCS